jgi:hypothetical protein
MTVTTTAPTESQRAAAVAAATGRQARPFAAPGGIRALTAVDTRSSDRSAEPRSEVHLSIEAVLNAAEGSSQQRIRTKAARLRQAVIELNDLIKAEKEAKAVEARVQQLRDELAAAETQLRTLRHPATNSPKSPATSTTTRDVSRAVRAWAEANKIEVNAYGKVPNDLVQQWQDATGGIL